jgi:hypothetical protein
LALEVSIDPPGFEWQHRQLGRRTADEPVEEQEVFCLGGSQDVSPTLPGGSADRQAGVDPEARACSRRQRANGADAAAAHEEGLSPARLARWSDQTKLGSAQLLEAAEALEDVLERLDAIAQSRRLLVAEALGQIREARSQARQRPAVEESVELFLRARGERACREGGSAPARDRPEGGSRSS